MPFCRSHGVQALRARGSSRSTGTEYNGSYELVKGYKLLAASHGPCAWLLEWSSEPHGAATMYRVLTLAGVSLPAEDRLRRELIERWRACDEELIRRIPTLAELHSTAYDRKNFYSLCRAYDDAIHWIDWFDTQEAVA